MSGGDAATESPEQAAAAALARRRRERRFAALRLGLLAALVAALFAAVALTGDLSADRVRSTVRDIGVLAPLAFIVVSSLLTVAMFPGPLLSGASGLLFGTALGTPVSIVAATLGACLAFSISRRFGAGAVDELSGRRVRVVQDFIAQRGFLAVLYARILPAMPYNVVNYAAGVTRVSLGTFALSTAIGCAPRAFAYTALGGSLSHLTSPAALVAYAVLLVMGVGGVVVAMRDLRAQRPVALTGARGDAGRSDTVQGEARCEETGQSNEPADNPSPAPTRRSSDA